MASIDFNALNLRISPLKGSGIATVDYHMTGRQPGELPYADGDKTALLAVPTPTLVTMETEATEE